MRRFISVTKLRADVGAVHGVVATGGPAVAARHELRMIDLADDDISGISLNLRMAFQAQIIVPLDEQGAIDRAVRRMANGAALTQRFVLPDERPRLFAMTIGARFVLPRHRERGAARGTLENIRAVRVMAIDAVHAVLDHRMMLGQAKFSVLLEMTIEAGRGVFAGIDDELAAAAAGLDVFAAGAVATFAAGARGEIRIVLVKTPVRAGREHARVIGVAIGAGGVADVSGAGNFRRRADRAIDRGASRRKKRRAQGKRQRGGGNFFGGNPHRQSPCAKALQEPRDVAEGNGAFQA
jgi:hypothetical protein